MERPSHIHFDSHHISHRLPLIGLALALQAGALWLFIHGLAIVHVTLPRGPITFTPFDEPPQPREPPPEPRLQPVPIAQPPNPLSGIKIEPTEGRPIVTATLPAEPVPVAPMPAGVTRAAMGVLATHTTPPYPPIARRIGAEGKVTLRLTVTAEGRVTQADVVTSSGRDDLDQTAQQWIVAHWIYKPAQANGVAVTSKALATVTFTLDR